MASVIFGSVFSGIEAASVAWSPLGWRAAFVSEIAKFPCAVLAHYYPDVPNYGDILNYESWPDASLDVLCGGPPCQSDSVAGKRGGMADPRGALKETYLRVVERYRPTWVLFEGVPGVLSVDEGRAFGALVGGLGELGYLGAWTSLDAQYRGLAQRRERVFFVGCARGWQCAAAVLFDGASLRGDSAPRRETRENLAGTLDASAGSGGADENDAEQNRLVGTLDTRGGDRADAAWTGRLIQSAKIAGTLQASGKAAGSATQQDAESGLLVAFGRNNTAGPYPTSAALSAQGGTGRMDFETETFITHTLCGEGFDASGPDRGTPLVPVALDIQQITSLGNRSQPSEISPTLNVGHRVVAFNARQDQDVSGNVSGPLDTDPYTQAIAFSSKDHGADAGEVSPTLRAMSADKSHANGGGQVSVTTNFGVRRLTPRECERLQGFPDDYTLIPYRGKPAKDGPRYHALGNSWAVPVVRWIGERIAMVNRLEQDAA